MKLRPCAIFLMLALMWGCGALEPAPGTVTGVVHGVKRYDAPQGPPLADHEITLIDSDTGNVAARTKSDANGKFSFSVQPGKYSVWGGEHAEYVRVTAGQESTVDIEAPDK